MSSGAGVHAVWIFGEPIPVTEGTIEKFEAINQRCLAILDDGGVTTNADRVLRIAGTINHPNKTKVKKGRGKSLAKMIHVGERLPVAALDKFVAMLPQPLVKEQKKEKPTNPANPAPERSLSALKEIARMICMNDPKFAQVYIDGDASEFKSGSEADMSMVAKLIYAAALTKQETVMLLTGHGCSGDAQSNDPDTVTRCWERCWDNSDAEPPTLASRLRHIAYSFNPKAREYVIDDLIQTGITLIAGQMGAGKTTGLVPIVASIAHLAPKDWGLSPKLRRKVVYITEDVDQVVEICRVISEKSGVPLEEWREWFVVIEAARLVTPIMKLELQGLLTDNSYNNEHGFCIQPLVVVDTRTAFFDIEDENDNGAASKIVAALKSLGVFPLWIITHPPKTMTNGVRNRKDVEELHARGASAWGGDVRTTAALFKDEDLGKRVFTIQKTRVGGSSEYNEIHIDTIAVKYEAVTAWDPNEVQTGTIFCGLPSLGRKEDRHEAAEEAQEQRKQEKAERAEAKKEQKWSDERFALLEYVAMIESPEAATISALKDSYGKMVYMPTDGSGRDLPVRSDKKLMDKRISELVAEGRLAVDPEAFIHPGNKMPTAAYYVPGKCRWRS
jgi:hypothetical protein